MDRETVSKIVVTLAIGFLIGYGVSDFMTKNGYNTGDSVDKVESYMYLEEHIPYVFRNKLNENMTIRHVRNVYESFGFSGRVVLGEEIDRLCGR